MTRGATESNGSAEEAYRDRNLAVQALARLAARAGYRVGLRERDSAWPILTIDLPTGQVSWHLPRAEIAGRWPDYEGEWDGHDLAQKRDRVLGFIRTHAPGARAGDLAACECYVRYLDRETRNTLRYGAHDPTCPTYRESRDPIDRANDDENRRALNERRTTP